MVTSSKKHKFKKQKIFTSTCTTLSSEKMIPPPPPSAKQHVNQTDASGLRKKSMMKEKGSSKILSNPWLWKKKSNYLTLIPDADRKISGSKPTANQVKKKVCTTGGACPAGQPCAPLMSADVQQTTSRVKDDPESNDQQKRQRVQISGSSSSSSRPLPPNSATADKADKPLGWWIHGHRTYNFHHFGITQENATRGRTRGGLGRGRETPQQEQNRLENPHLAGPVPVQISKE